MRSVFSPRLVRPALAVTLLFAMLFVALLPHAAAATTQLNSGTCGTVIPGNWFSSSSACYLTASYTISSGNTLEIPSGVSLVDQLNLVSVQSGGVLLIDQGGTYDAFHFSNSGTVINNGQLGFVLAQDVNQVGGVIENYGSLLNGGTITNDGTILNECGGFYDNQINPGEGVINGNALLQLGCPTTTTVTSFEVFTLTYVSTATSVSTTTQTVAGPTTTVTSTQTSTTTSTSTSTATSVSTSTTTATVSTTSTSTVPSIAVSCSPSSLPLGHSTKCTATTIVGGGSPGTIAFQASGAGTFTTSACQTPYPNILSCKVSFTPSANGVQTITATYSGDSQFPSASATTQVTVS